MKSGMDRKWIHVGLAAIWAFGALASQAPAFERRVTMSGECHLEVEPDRASVIFTGEHRA